MLKVRWKLLAVLVWRRSQGAGQGSEWAGECFLCSRFSGNCWWCLFGVQGGCCCGYLGSMLGEWLHSSNPAETRNNYLLAKRG